MTTRVCAIDLGVLDSRHHRELLGQGEIPSQSAVIHYEKDICV